MGWVIGAVVCFLFGGFGCYMASQTQSINDAGVAVLLIIAGIVLTVKYIYIKTGITAKRNLVKQEKNKKLHEKQNKRIFTLNLVKHQAGLPLAQDTPCTIEYYKAAFKIYGGGNTFELKTDKVTDIVIKSDAEIQSQYVSSVGGAVAGGMLFGPLGAIVGGRAKEKKTMTVEYYMIFTYRSEDGINYASFELPQTELSKARKWINEFRSTTGNTSGQDTIVL